MIHRVLYLGRWIVDFLFAEKEYDIEEVLSMLYEMGASYDVLTMCKELMQDGGYNTGFTYTDQELFNALVVIGPTSSGAEYIDTLVHEIHHLAVAIASNLNIDLEGETPAYLAGDAARELADIVCRMGCSCCHDK